MSGSALLPSRSIPTLPNAPKPVPVAVLSSEQGAQIKQQADQKLAALSPIPIQQTEQQRSAALKDSGLNAEQQKNVAAGKPSVDAQNVTAVTLINPATEQSVTFENPDINKDAINAYVKDGYQLAEGKGNVPSWLTPSGATAGKETPEQKAQAEADEAAKELKELSASLSKFTISDADLQAQVQGISAQWEARIADMQKINASRKGNINTLGVRLGSQYAGGAGGAFGGIVSEEERQGIVRISELEGQKQSAIAAAKLAALQQNWTVYSKQVDLAEKAYANKVKEVENLQKATADQNKLIFDQNKLIADSIKDAHKAHYDQVEKPIQEVIADLGKTGAPPEIIAAVQAVLDKGGTLGEAVTAAAGYLRNKPAIVQELDFVNAERAVAGLPPYSLDEYQTMDANRRRSIVNINSGGLNTAQTSNFLRITDKYQADPIIMAADKGKTAVIIADQVLADPGNAANQLKSLYVLVKNLDPDSAVREGEINLAQQTQSYLQRFATSIQRIGEGQVISADAATQLAKATKELATAWTTSAASRTNRYKSQARNADPIVGNSFDQYLADYEELGSTVDAAIQGNQDDPLNLGLSGSVTNDNPLDI